MSDTEQLLEQLGARGLMSVCYERPHSSSFTGEPELVDDVPSKVDSHAGSNVWISAATLYPTATGRGKAQDTARLQTLPLDIDVKDGGFKSLEDAHTLIDKLSALLKAEPIAIVATGGGLQPWWKLDPSETQWESKGPEDPHLTELATTVKRWGELARSVAAKNNLGNLDSVFDLARMLRAPDSVNYKYATPRKVETTFTGSTETVSYQHLLTLLDAAKIDTTPATLTKGEVLAAHETWVYGSQTCTYVMYMVEGWSGDKPANLKGNKSGGRHQWLLYNAVRLNAAYRQGCITEGYYNAAVRTLSERLTTLVTDPKFGEPRDCDGEVNKALTWARATVETFTADELAKRLGDHHTQKPLTELTHVDPHDPWLPLRVETQATHPEPIPIDGLPPVMRDMVAAVAAGAGAPRDVALGAALGIAAAATRGTWDAVIHGGWTINTTALWTLSLAASGTGKGPTFSPLKAPLVKAERAVKNEVIQGNRGRKIERDKIEMELKKLATLEAEIKKAVKDKAAKDKANGGDETSKDTTGGGDEDGVLKLEAQRHDQRERNVPAYILDEGTPEALGVAMENNGGPVALISSEAEALAIAAGSYSDGGAQLGIYNRSKDAESFENVRISRDGTSLDRAVMTWAISVQPQVMRGYATAATEGSGFLFRFLFMYPASTLGTRVFPLPEIPQGVRAAWDTAIADLHAHAWEIHRDITDDPEDVKDVPLLTFTPEAGQLIIDLANAIEQEYNSPESRVTNMFSWASKHATDIARVATVLELLGNPHTRIVSADSVRAALSMHDGFVAHAAAAFDGLRDLVQEDTEARLLEAIRKLGQQTFTTREIHQRVRQQTSWVRSAEDVRSVLLDLCEGYSFNDSGPIRGPLKTTGKGRPTEMWECHPDLLGGQK